MDINSVMKKLEANNFKPYFVENRKDVIPLIKTLIKPGEEVACGGSMTLDACGVIDFLDNGDYKFFDRRGLQGEDIRNAYIKAFGCDTYFCSSNAVTENGELYNVDGNSNRVACIVYGPRQVIMVVGINKIVKNIDQAAKRVKELAAVKNTVRLSCDTPCSKIGKCISLEKENPSYCDGCKSSSRICCNYVISAQQRHKDRIKIIIVNEELGY